MRRRCWVSASLVGILILGSQGGCAWTARDPILSAPLFRLPLSDAERRNADQVRKLLADRNLGVTRSLRTEYHKWNIATTFPDRFQAAFSRTPAGTAFRFRGDGVCDLFCVEPYPISLRYRAILQSNGELRRLTDYVPGSGALATEFNSRLIVNGGSPAVTLADHRRLEFVTASHRLELRSETGEEPLWSIVLPEGASFLFFDWNIHSEVVLAGIAYPGHLGPWFSPLQINVFSGILLDVQNGVLYQIDDDAVPALFSYAKASN